MTELRHVLTILAVEDLAASAAFYAAAFGWTASVATPVYVEFALLGGQRLGVYERHGFGRNIGQVPAKVAAGELAPTEIYLYVDDPVAAIARIQSAGARELSPWATRPWGDEVAYFADPSGNVLALARPARPVGAASA